MVGIPTSLRKDATVHVLTQREGRVWIYLMDLADTGATVSAGSRHESSKDQGLMINAALRGLEEGLGLQLEVG